MTPRPKSHMLDPMELNRENTITELTQRLEYCADQIREVDNLVARQDWAHADIELSKAVDEYRKCLVDIRVLGTKTGMPQ